MNAVRRKGFVLVSACAFSVILVVMWASFAFAASGDLDPAFRGDGKVMTNFTPGFDGANAVAIQSNGKVVVAGGTGATLTEGNFALVRYNANGTLDATFGGNGKVTTAFTPGRDIANAVAIQADGKIVAAGEAGGIGRTFALARYNANGTLDTTFGGDGKVMTTFRRCADANAVAIQADGKIVAAGEAGGIGRTFAVARYNANGTLDTTFGGDGKVMTNFSIGMDSAAGVVVQSNGKIVAAGTAYVDCGCNKFGLARYNANGTLDTTFGGDGKVTTSFNGGAHANALALQANGRIVVAGSASELAWFALARYRPNGTLDPTFSANGKLTTRMGRGETAATGVAIQANGKVVAAGYTDAPHEFGDTFGPGKFALARYRADGTLDPSFGGDGRVKTRFGTRTAAANTVAIQGNGKIVAAGTARRGRLFAVARYTLDGSRDTTFSGDGRVTTNFTSGADAARGVAVRAGEIVCAGHAAGSGGRFAVSRYLA